MNLPPVYLASHDTSSHILPCVKYLYNKYMPGVIITIVGYTKPDFVDFDDTFRFVSVGLPHERKSIKEWSKRIASYMKTIADEFILFSVNDILVIDYGKLDMLKKCVKYMENDKNISNIHVGSSRIGNKLIKKTEFDIYQNESYQSSLQLNLWRTSELVRIFDNNFDLVDVEIKGSCMCKKSFTFIIPGQKGPEQRIIPTMPHSALSMSRNPGKICIIGLKNKDVEYFVKNKILNPKVLSYGWWTNMNLPYLEYGDCFNLDKLKGKIRESDYNECLELYGDIHDKD